ncbi:MAG: hypothetical protein K0R17_1780 [Rariglobus sp.]|jgi:hypothetical protein|nr:hypothetical protein [Rariglobus sp.]
MKRILLLTLLGTTSAGTLLAQSSSEVIIDRVQQGTPPPAPTAPSATTKDEKGDLDGGTQRIAETRKLPFKLTFAYDVQAYYTSNVFLQPSDEVESVIVAQTLLTRADFNSFTVGEALITPTASLVYQHYNHALGTGDETREDLDFDAYSIPLALRVRCGNNWEFTAGLTATAVYSLEGPPSYNLTYKSVTPSVSVRKLVSLGRDHILSFGGGISYVITDSDTPGGLLDYREDRNDKVDYSIDAGYYYLRDRWVFGPYARLTYSDYLHYQEAGFFDVNREDLVGSVGVSVSYNFTPWATARAFTSYDWRNPQGDSPVDYGYKTTNAGLGLTLSVSF